MDEDDPRDEPGFAKAQSPFALAAADLAAIFAAYDFRCAFTGADLRSESAADPAGALLHLTPVGTRPNELVPAVSDAIFAYERGHLTIGPEFNFLIDLSRIDPEVLGRLNPGGRLRLPSVDALYPPSSVLKAHRDEFAEGMIS